MVVSFAISKQAKKKNPKNQKIPNNHEDYMHIFGLWISMVVD